MVLRTGAREGPCTDPLTLFKGKLELLEHNTQNHQTQKHHKKHKTKQHKNQKQVANKGRKGNSEKEMELQRPSLLQWEMEKQ